MVSHRCTPPFYHHLLVAVLSVRTPIVVFRHIGDYEAVFQCLYFDLWYPKRCCVLYGSGFVCTANSQFALLNIDIATLMCYIQHKFLR